MKKALFLLLFVPAILSSCCKKAERDPKSDRPNSVAVIIDDLLWNGDIGDSIRNKFAAPVVGLPQEEPTFTLYQYPVKLLEGYTANSRNVIVIKKGQPNHFKITKDEFRKPQTVIYISGRTSRDIVDMIEQHSAAMIARIHNGEIEYLQQQTQAAPPNSAKVAAKFNIALSVPASYSVAMEKPGFLWLKRDITGGNTSLLAYEIPISSLSHSQTIGSDIMRIRDSIGKLYVHGAVPDTHMVTEDSYAPYMSKTTFCKRTVYETKGTWILDHDFMSGPFINYTIIDKPANRVLVLEGFCYAPSKDKRDLILELEAILKSVRFIKHKQ